MGRRVRPVVAALLVAVLAGGVVVAPVASAQSVSKRKLREAREQYRKVQEQLNRLAREYAKEQERLAKLETKIRSTDRAIAKASKQADALRVRLRDRVRLAYMMGGVGPLDFLLSSASFRDFSLRAVILERQSSEDEDLILELRRTHAELAAKERILKGQKRDQARVMSGIRRKAGELDATFADARALLSRLEAENQAELLRIGGRLGKAVGRAYALSRCPAAGPHAFSNDWGAPRGGGSRRHKGNDIFAPMGSPAVATVSGTVKRHSRGGNAGLSVYLWGDDGNEYFYAHMSRFEGEAGRRVGAGQTIAYVGNSGNARGGAPHIHFEIHPGGGSAINPYASLVRVC